MPELPVVLFFRENILTRGGSLCNPVISTDTLSLLPLDIFCDDHFDYVYGAVELASK